MTLLIGVVCVDGKRNCLQKINLSIFERYMNMLLLLLVWDINGIEQNGNWFLYWHSLQLVNSAIPDIFLFERVGVCSQTCVHKTKCAKPSHRQVFCQHKPWSLFLPNVGALQPGRVLHLCCLSSWHKRCCHGNAEQNHCDYYFFVNTIITCLTLFLLLMF